MRKLLVGIFVLAAVVAGLAQADPQTSASEKTGTVLKAAPLAPQREFSIDPLPLVISQEPKQRNYSTKTFSHSSVVPGNVVAQGPCFTMRAYLFSPGSVGSAPRRTGYTTCTPSNALQMRQTTRPVVRLLPQ